MHDGSNKPTPKILIVDDEKLVCQHLRQVLSNEGYDAGFILKPELLFKRLEGEIFDLILMDVNMPGIDGVTLLRHLKDHPQFSDLPVIMLTGEHEEQLLADCLAFGAADYVTKPIREIALVARVKSVISVKFTIDELILQKKQTNQALEEKKSILNELQEALLQLELHNELMKNTFDSMLEGVIRVNKEFQIQMLSAKACQIVGIAESEALNKPAVSIFGVPIAGPNGLLIETSQNQKQVKEQSTKIFCPSGAVVPVSLSIVALKETKSHSGWLLIFRDLREEERQLRKESRSVSFGRLVSCDPQMKEIFEIIDKVSSKNATILIQGETGTGKEVVSREIHERSRRAQGPFHAVNCGAISPNLLESEFFGHERGAFTGAQFAKPGRFELANHGTLFLDEIGEIPFDLQSKLLRALQEKKFERVGGTKTVDVDIRIIAATNRDLQEMVAEKKFREDLYYRLNVVQILLPLLRERAHDIPLISMSIVKELNQRENRKVQNIESPALQQLMDYPWPGNIRELYHVLEYAFAFSDGPLIQLDHFPKKLQEFIASNKITEPAPQNEKELILRALQQTNFHKGKAAALLGVHPTTLSRKLRKFQI